MVNESLALALSLILGCVIGVVCSRSFLLGRARYNWVFYFAIWFIAYAGIYVRTFMYVFQ